MKYRKMILYAFVLITGLFLFSSFSAAAGGKGTGAGEDTMLFRNPKALLEERVDDLIRRLTLKEKAGLLGSKAHGVKRLGIPPFKYSGECLHGVARAGIATVFPQATGMAATWDYKLMHKIGDVISTEARAKFHAAVRKGKYDQALTFWSPTINLLRDPRWGRAQETYGEDPFFIGRMAVEFIKGLQGDDPKYLKVGACAKHFAVHDGPESLRRQFDARPSRRDLYESYLPQFKAAVQEGKVEVIMGAYNRVYGESCCASAFLLEDILRKKWGFKGYVVSDCSALVDIWKTHKNAKDTIHAAAMALKAGCDLNCGNTYAPHLVKTVESGLLTEKDIDKSLRRVLKIRFKLGLFDPPEMVPYASIPISENDKPGHSKLALDVARKGIVLLKNDGVLPLDLSKIHEVGVVGPNAEKMKLLLGSYNGMPSHPVTILQGIKNACEAANVKVVYTSGCSLTTSNKVEVWSSRNKGTAKKFASSDVIIFIGGGDHEGEGRDRKDMELPFIQTALLKVLEASGTPVVFVNLSGAAVAMPWEAENLQAILQAWYPGQNGGTAVADILFGKTNPAGRLPFTIYRSSDDLPPIVNYSMENRTYRFFTGKPLFAFGHGLSYTKFKYSDAEVKNKTIASDGAIKLSVRISNIGEHDGDEVVQIYAYPSEKRKGDPIRSLIGFKREMVSAGKSKSFTFSIPVKRLALWDEKKKEIAVRKGQYILEIGAASDDVRSVVKIEIK